MTKINWKPLKVLLAKSIIAIVATAIGLFALAVIVGMFITKPVVMCIATGIILIVVGLIWAIGYLEDYT